MGNAQLTLKRKTASQPSLHSVRAAEVEVDSGEPATSPPCVGPDRLLYRPEEAAEALGISESTLYALVRKKEIPGVYLGASRRFRRADLEAFAESLSDSPSAVGRATGARRPKAA